MILGRTPVSSLPHLRDRQHKDIPRSGCTAVDPDNKTAGSWGCYLAANPLSCDPAGARECPARLQGEGLFANAKAAENAIEHRFGNVFAENFAEGLAGAAQVDGPEVEGELVGDRGLDLLEGGLGAG